MNPWSNFKLSKCSYIKEDQELLDFQQYAIYQALSKDRYLFGLPTGAGKSFSSLASYFYYLEVYQNTKLIIITNTSAILQFNSEIDKFFNYPNERILIHSSIDSNYKEFRANAFKEFYESSDKNILIMNYQVLNINLKSIQKTCEEIKKQGKKLFIIYDEATAFKNTKTNTFKSVSTLTLYANKILGLTATLSKGKLEEAYGIFKGIGIRLAFSKKRFLETFCMIQKIPRQHFFKITGYKNLNLFNDTIKPHSILLNKSSISDSLPSFLSKYTLLSLDTNQTNLLNYLKNEIYNPDNELIPEIVKIGYTHRCCIDPSIVNLNDEINLLPDPKYLSPKTKEILRLLEEYYVNEKIVIYCSSKVYINKLQNIIKTTCINSNYKNVLTITGDVSVDQREVNKDLFTNDDKYNIILINRAGIEAINLQASNNLIVCDIPDSAGNLVQLLGRISRIGSNHKTLYVNYLLMNKSQDQMEYFIVHKSLFLLKKILGEFEKNAIDYQTLKNDKLLGIMTDTEIQNSSIDKILLTFRKKSKV